MTPSDILKVYWREFMLSQINDLWKKYKKDHDYVSEVEISGISFDAADGVEASFDLMEMLEGNYVLHLTRRFPVYRSEFVHFLLMHEFTHLYDFLTYPGPRPGIEDLKERDRREENVNTASDRKIFGVYGEINLPEKPSGDNPFEGDTGKRLFDYMNTYSEYHACQTAFKDVMRNLRPGTAIDVDKNQVPAPFRDISIKRMLSGCLRKAHGAYQEFAVMLLPQIFVIYFRQIMYIFGYLSFFDHASDILSQTFDVLKIDSNREDYFRLFEVLKTRDIDRILEYSNKIYSDSYVPFVKNFIRRTYDPSLYTEEELDQITPDNYHDFAETMANRKGGRLWSGRGSPVYGVNDVNKAYGAVDVDTIKKMIGRNKS